MPVVILYAEIGTKKFTSFHKVLSEKAEEGKLIYVLRHFVAVSSNAFAIILLIKHITEITHFSINSIYQ